MIPRPILLAILLLLGMAWPLAAEAGSSTTMRIRRHLIDFGTIPFGSCVRDSFTVENIGTDLLGLVGTELVRDTVDTLHETVGRVGIVRGIDGIVLPRNRFTTVVVEFCAKDYGCATVPIVLRSIDGQLDTVIVRGCTEEPDNFLGDYRLDFGTVRHRTTATATFTFTNRQSFPIRIIDAYRASGPNVQLVTEIPSGGIMVPFQGTQPLTFRYDAAALGPDTARFRIMQDSGWIWLTVTARSGEPVIVATPDTVGFGKVVNGGSKDLPVDIANVGDFPVTISNITFGTKAFGLAPGGERHFTLAAGEHHSLLISFMPTSGAGPYEDSASVINDGEGPPVNIILRGNGVDISDRVIWLDTTLAPVTEIATLGLHIAPGILSAEGVYSLRFRIGFSPVALEPIDVETGAADYSATLQRIDDSTAEISIQSAGPEITGENLLSLRFRSFSTARPDNVVSLVGLDSMRNTPCRSGLVMLTGCGVGAIAFATKRVRIEGVELDPGSASAVISYIAPEGADGWARLVDLHGAEVLRVALPVGDGSRRDLRLALSGVAAGFYLVQLRAGDDAVAMPLMMIP